MEFTGKWGMLGIVLLWTVSVRAGDSRTRIVVLVNDTSDIKASVLFPAETEAARLFRSAGIEVTWVNCEEDAVLDDCGRPPGPNEFVLHIVSTGNTESESVFGEAFLGEDGKGKYCDIFFDRVQRAYRGFDAGAARLLAAVAAHELGHLLLGSHSHSRFGLMQPTWSDESLRKIDMGMLSFTRQEAGKIRERIAEDEPAVSLRLARSASALPAATAVGGRQPKPRGFLP